MEYFGVRILAAGRKLFFDSMERETGIEPATSSLGSYLQQETYRSLEKLKFPAYPRAGEKGIP
jgi:hypothetical protein